MKWANREEWRPDLETVIAEHVAPASEAFGLTFAQIGETLGALWGVTLWGCAFEDFLTRSLDPQASVGTPRQASVR
jgi:hypothetical protein